jgi:DNA-binding HxlR family transcriptional regulator
MTTAQREALQALTGGPLTAWTISPESGRWLTYDAAHARLRRLEDKGLVRRITDPPNAKWELTHAGRAALQLTR